MKIKSSILTNAAFFLLLLALLILRRPDQLFFAHVWDEDKNIILQWFDLGILKTFLTPINGYLITVPKLINFIGLKLSFLYYPEVSTALAILFDLFVILMVAYSPNFLGWRKTAAFAVVLIPIGAEVYILPLYTLWFAGILLIISMLWQFQASNKKWFAARILLTFLGGSSSPLALILMPAFWLRAFLAKSKQEIIIASIATLFAAVQGWFIYSTKAANPIAANLSQVLLACFDKFFGQMFFHFIRGGHPTTFWCLSILLVPLIAWLVYRLPRSAFTLELALIVYFIVVALVTSCLRIDVTIIDQFQLNARYFFYPYISIAFLLCWLGYHSNRREKIIVATLLLLSLTNVLSYYKYSRSHDHMDWRGDVAKCLGSNEGHHFPVFFDGRKNSTWDMYLTSQQCKQLAGIGN